MCLERKRMETRKERSVLNGGLFERVFCHKYHNMSAINSYARLNSEMGSSVGHELLIDPLVIAVHRSLVHLDFKGRGKSNNKERFSFLTKHQNNASVVFHKCLKCRWDLQKIDRTRVLKSMCAICCLFMI